MIDEIDLDDDAIAARVVEIQRAAYAVEAELIGFDGIPNLRETVADLRTRADLIWRGAFVDGELAATIAWIDEGTVIDIDRLAVDPAFARRGLGRALVRAVPAGRPTIVATGAANAPAVALYAGEGFRPIDETEIAPGVLMAHFRREP